jgi:hypothetical protein
MRGRGCGLILGELTSYYLYFPVQEILLLCHSWTRLISLAALTTEQMLQDPPTLEKLAEETVPPREERAPLREEPKKKSTYLYFPFFLSSFHPGAVSLTSSSYAFY